MLIVSDPGDPNCATDARIAWVLFLSQESDVTSSISRSALPEQRVANADEKACVYSSPSTIPMPGIPQLQWDIRAVDEGSWVATCSAALAATDEGQHNVVKFIRGSNGCTVNPP
jgi:hypothetical protein